MEYDYDENEFLIEDTRRYIVLVIYDITDNKRRTKMVKCLERYGVRVQKSAFEAFLTERKYDELVARTTHLIDPHTDSLRIASSRTTHPSARGALAIATSRMLSFFNVLRRGLIAARGTMCYTQK